MTLSSRAIAVSGVGYAPLVLALAGFASVVTLPEGPSVAAEAPPVLYVRAAHAVARVYTSTQSAEQTDRPAPLVASRTQGALGAVDERSESQVSEHAPPLVARYTPSVIHVTTVSDDEQGDAPRGGLASRTTEGALSARTLQRVSIIRTIG